MSLHPHSREKLSKKEREKLISFKHMLQQHSRPHHLLQGYNPS